jgi:hypothetical protein
MRNSSKVFSSKGDFMSVRITIPKTNIVKHEIEYPASDGKPMAETDVHADQMIDI